MKSTMGIWVGAAGAFLMAIGGALIFDFLYKLTTTTEFHTMQSPDSLAELLGFISFFFLGSGLWFVVQSGKKD
jgi:hypothetical protein